MIILDTNVVSELMRAAPDPAVVRWLNRQPPAQVWVTVLTQMEIFVGVELLPAGRRRESLAAAAKAVFDEDFRGRVLSFGPDAAASYAGVYAKHKREGRNVSVFDVLIAAVALSKDAVIATRNLRDFEQCGVELVDPWAAGAAR